MTEFVVIARRVLAIAMAVVITDRDQVSWGDLFRTYILSGESRLSAVLCGVGTAGSDAFRADGPEHSLPVRALDREAVQPGCGELLRDRVFGDSDRRDR